MAGMLDCGITANSVKQIVLQVNRQGRHDAEISVVDESIVDEAGDAVIADDECDTTTAVTISVRRPQPPTACAGINRSALRYCVRCRRFFPVRITTEPIVAVGYFLVTKQEYLIARIAASVWIA